MIKYEFLKERANNALARAKEMVEEDKIFNLVIVGKETEGEAVVPLDFSSERARFASIQAIQQTMLIAEPDYAVHVSDAYMRESRPEDAEEQRKKYKFQEISRSPDRIECIIVAAASTIGEYSIVQPYRREGKKVVYEEIIETTGEEAKMQSAIFGDVWEKLIAREAKNSTAH